MSGAALCPGPARAGAGSMRRAICKSAIPSRPLQGGGAGGVAAKVGAGGTGRTRRQSWAAPRATAETVPIGSQPPEDRAPQRVNGTAGKRAVSVGREPGSAAHLEACLGESCVCVRAPGAIGNHCLWFAAVALAAQQGAFAAVGAFGGFCLAVTMMAVYPTAASLVRPSRMVDFEILLRRPPRGGDMLGSPGSNLFVEEFNDLFLAAVDIIDIAVSRYVGKDCELVAWQEEGHRKMHYEGCEERGSLLGSRLYCPFLRVLGRMLLRSGRGFGVATTLGCETGSLEMFYTLDRALLRFGDDSLSDLALFHMHEEVEHAAVTVKNLRDRSLFKDRLWAVIPTLCVDMFLLLAPPLLKVARSPLEVLRQPKRAARDLGVYYAAFVPAFIAAAWRVVAYLPSPNALDSEERVAQARAHFDRRVEGRGIQYDVMTTEIYPLEMI